MTTPLSLRPADQTPTYVVAGGNHVTIMLDRTGSNETLDVIEVRAAPGGGPPPHRHAFAEWFRVLEGKLTFTEEREGTMRATQTLSRGDSVFVAPWVYHGTLNLSNAPCRFEVVGQPAMCPATSRRPACSSPSLMPNLTTSHPVRPSCMTSQRAGASSSGPGLSTPHHREPALRGPLSN